MVYSTLTRTKVQIIEQRGIRIVADAETIEQRIRPLIAEQLGVEESKVTRNASFVDDLNADSLDLVEMIMSLEEEFKLEIPDDDVEKIATVGDAIDYIQEHTE